MCGCRGNGVRNVSRGGRPVVSPRSVSIQGPALTPRKLEQLSAQSTSPIQGLSAEQRATEKKRRESLLKKLGRL